MGLGGKHGAGVPGYGVWGSGVRGPGVWKTWGLVENTGSGGKHGVWWKTPGMVENTCLRGKHGVPFFGKIWIFLTIMRITMNSASNAFLYKESKLNIPWESKPFSRALVFSWGVYSYTTETGRPRIQRHALQLTVVPNVNDFDHVALFVKSKRWTTNVVTFLFPCRHRRFSFLFAPRSQRFNESLQCYKWKFSYNIRNITVVKLSSPNRL